MICIISSEIYLVQVSFRSQEKKLIQSLISIQNKLCFTQKEIELVLFNYFNDIENICREYQKSNVKNYLEK